MGIFDDNVNDRYTVTMEKIYCALKCLGHEQLWLRNNGKYNRLIITWDNYVTASYNPYTKSWNFRKSACRVNDNPSGRMPPGPTKTLTELTGGDVIFQLSVLLES
ncbi:hypothetical protein [Serratia marcescens]|uniref:hypothetical protein n=1 Tax=Serratia marcescens TaxID=615 RepID=UPI0013DD158A|nr:hypothetical protein [Serratia marcescens]